MHWAKAWRLGSGPCLGALLAFACSDSNEAPSHHRKIDPAAPPPHVLLLTLDTLRADALGCYGAATPTPHLDALADQGARFSCARTVAPLTLPAHAALLSGRFPAELGVRDNGSFFVPNSAALLSEVLGAEGYECAAVVAAPVLAARFGIAQGFETFVDPVSKDQNALASHGYVPGDLVVERTREVLAARDTHRPLFLWTHFFDTHRPLVPPPEDLTAEFGSREAAEALSELERERGLYRAEVRFLDRQVGALLTEVRAALHGEPLLVVAIADHGEGNGDHGELAHGYFLYDTTVRVPLLVQGPGVSPGVLDTPVSSVDVFPTVLELLGLEAQPCSGVSLAALLQGGSLPETQRPIFFETCYPYTNHRWSPAYGLFAPGLGKLIDSSRPEWFDVERDPNEERDAFAADRPEVLELRTRLRSLASLAHPSSRRGVDESERALLKALGYETGQSELEDPAVFTPGARDESLPAAQDRRELIQLHGQAFTLRGRGDLGGAADAMLRAAELDPENPHYLEQAGALLLEAGRPAEALPLLARAAQIAPEVASVWANLARAQERAGNLDASIASLERSVALDAGPTQPRLDLGRLLSQHRGDHAQAIRWLESALADLAETDPMHAAVAKKIGELRER